MLKVTGSVSASLQLRIVDYMLLIAALKTTSHWITVWTETAATIPHNNPEETTIGTIYKERIY